MWLKHNTASDSVVSCLPLVCHVTHKSQPQLLLLPKLHSCNLVTVEDSCFQLTQEGEKGLQDFNQARLNSKHLECVWIKLLMSHVKVKGFQSSAKRISLHAYSTNWSKYIKQEWGYLKLKSCIQFIVCIPSIVHFFFSFFLRNISLNLKFLCKWKEKRYCCRKQHLSGVYI